MSYPGFESIGRPGIAQGGESIHRLPARVAVALSVVNDLAEFLEASERLLILTGAGVSVPSGIPDYRDEEGRWKRKPPVNYRDFVAGEGVRQRYWARAMVGWERFREARPNAAHAALAGLEAVGRVSLLVTQNVDRLHQRAGSEQVLDLHGRLDRVVCLACGDRSDRDEVQARLLGANPGWRGIAAATAPDGDADVAARDFSEFALVPCPQCGGVLKPDVVFFGESVPRDRVEAGYAAVAGADAVLVAGSSLRVWSGYRFVRAAAERGIPVAVVNLGRTRADDLAAVTVRGPCEEVLPAATSGLSLSPGGSGSPPAA
jgi:NAD-dependent SIR2 family protein deacetylase